MTQRVDMVRELIDRMLAASQRDGCLTEDIAIQIEQQFRRDYRGATCEIYESPRALLAQKQEVVISAYLAGHPVDEITRTHGVSRATLYRYLKK